MTIKHTDMIKLSKDQENDLWTKAMSFLGPVEEVKGYWLSDYCVNVEAMQALIDTAHVVLEDDDELLGLFVCTYGFVWVSLMKRPDGNGLCQACIAEESEWSEFYYYQERMKQAA